LERRYMAKVRSLLQRPARPSPSPCRNTLMPRPHRPAHSALSRTQTACDTLADMQAVTTSIGSVVNHTVTVICDAALCARSTFLLCTASHLCSFEWQRAQMCHPLGRPLGRGDVAGRCASTRCVRAAQRGRHQEVRMGRVSLSRALHSIGHNVVGRLQLGRIMGGVVSHQGGR
jgi:hypothetical protein